MTGYESRYNVRLNKCVIDVFTTDKQTSVGTIWPYLFVQDAFEGKQYRILRIAHRKDKKYWEVAPSQCEVLLRSGEQQFCKSADEFTLLIRVYMQDSE